RRADRLPDRKTAAFAAHAEADRGCGRRDIAQREFAVDDVHVVYPLRRIAVPLPVGIRAGVEAPVRRYPVGAVDERLLRFQLVGRRAEEIGEGREAPRVRVTELPARVVADLPLPVRAQVMAGIV